MDDTGVCCLEDIRTHTLIVNLDTGCVHRPPLDPPPLLKPSATAFISNAISRYLAELDVVEQHETVYVEMEGIGGSIHPVTLTVNRNPYSLPHEPPNP